MDEGKPTKAKWWSRPRPDTGRPADDDGDWHLPAPAVASGGGPEPVVVGPAADGADASGRSDVSGVTDATDSSAEFGGPDKFGGPDRPDASGDASGAVPDAVQGAVAAPETLVDAAPPVSGPSGPFSVPESAPEPPGEKYTDVPYGAPGPWAPAPPVQHPVPVTAPMPAAPWQQYDPWAGPVSLSQSGAPVGARPRRGRRGLVLGAVLIALASGGVGGAIGSYLERNGGTDVELPQAGAESTHRAPGSVAGIAASALPGVVTIHTKGSSEQGTGTGFVLDNRGHILTNNHVVDPAGTGGEISVTFAGGESARAKVVGHDTGYDLAVIRVDHVRGLKPLPLGNSESVQVGDPVVAIGAPFDLANTVTAGIISAKDRPITAGGEKGDGSDVSYVDALQTDAPINPGNSGGPLVDSKARVIGINSAIRSADGGAELDGGQSGSIGLGFAIPINQAKRVAEELINTGRATHPVIGVTLDMDYTGDGARVGTKGNSGGSSVSPGGPGARAGIQPRDVITAVDGVRVHSGEELIVRIRSHRPKDKLVLAVERDGKEREVSLVLGSADGN
ncbi:trypsin-like peptidase domain-containing protein [Streptomyces sp. HUAS MG91]|uniref:Trypsin-like peptidase domain-containing protein n=1 Tax=Streptomyces tabacisoli TaxID=3156398 RepID=A0AAU8IX98_9ACTN